MYVVSVRQRRVAVQLVGLEKIEERQKHLDALVSAMLMYTGVASVGPPGELRATAPSELCCLPPLLSSSGFELPHVIG